MANEKSKYSDANPRAPELPLPRGRKTRLTFKNVEAALRATAGIKKLASERLNVSPQTLNRWIDKNPKILPVIDEIVAEMCDFAVGKLIGLIQAGDLGAIKYYLDNKGQGFGFGLRKLSYRDGEGEITRPGMLVTEGKMSPEEFDRKFGLPSSPALQ